MKPSLLHVPFFVLAVALPACGASSSEGADNDASEGALEQGAGKYKLSDYTMVKSLVTVNEGAEEVAKRLVVGGAKWTTDQQRVYVGITEKDAGLGDTEETIYGLACREGGGAMISMRCDFYATVKTTGVKTNDGVAALTIDGKLGKLIADSFTKANGKPVEAGNLNCTTAGTPKCRMLVRSGDILNLREFVGGDGLRVVERELSFFYP